MTMSTRKERRLAKKLRREKAESRAIRGDRKAVNIGSNRHNDERLTVGQGAKSHLKTLADNELRQARSLVDG